MNDRALNCSGTVGAVLAAICCAAPLLVAGLPFTGLGAWLAGAGLVVLPLMLVGVGLVACGLHHRQAKAAVCEMKIHRKA